MSESAGSPQDREAVQNAARESDGIAVERTLAGERDAFRSLVERHSQQLFRLAYRMTGNEHDAEEVVQEAFLRAYRNLGQFGSRANFGTWVYRIAANYAIDRMRQKRNEESRRSTPSALADEPDQDPLELAPDERPTPDRLATNRELRKKMEEALKALSASERTAFVMRHWEGCAIEEIAAVLKSTTSAAKNTVFRSVQKLRHSLEPYVGVRGTLQAKAAAALPEAKGTEL
ncbi:MAG TPA: RNA polymerase sigma factor [Candidatus Acidoferrum sp.]|nr:RNA polymerase sigma factor [Candidatus Acidoferrum sp.]